MSVATTSSPLSGYPWNRNDRTGFAVSVIGPLLVVLLANALFYATGVQEQDPAYHAVSFNPPGWLVGAIWCVIYPMWGAARWYARQSGLAGRRRSRWVVALMVWGLVYPLVTSQSDVWVSAVANMVSLALALITAMQVRGVSKRAFWLVAPSVVWISFATILGFAAVAAA